MAKKQKGNSGLLSKILIFILIVIAYKYLTGSDSSSSKTANPNTGTRTTVTTTTKNAATTKPIKTATARPTPTTSPVPTECPHSAWIVATCVSPRKCRYCGFTVGEPTNIHKFSGGNCQEQKTCSVCGAVSDEYGAHNYRGGTCIEYGVCTICGAIEEAYADHRWIVAKCTTPKTCSVCGQTTGEPLGHSLTSATCDNPSKCTRCNYTEGVALGHDFVSANGSNIKTCSRCRKTEAKVKNYAVGTAQVFDDLEITVTNVSFSQYLGGLSNLAKADTGFCYCNVYVNVYNTGSSTKTMYSHTFGIREYSYVLYFDNNNKYPETFAEYRDFLQGNETIPAKGTLYNKVISFKVPIEVRDKKDLKLRFEWNNNSRWDPKDIIWNIR